MEHHVYFWLKDEKKDDASRKAFEAGIEALYRVKSIESAIWGVPAKTPARPVTDHSWDYALSVRFATLEDHDYYQDCKEHDDFIDAFKDWWAKVEVKDLQN